MTCSLKCIDALLYNPHEDLDTHEAGSELCRGVPVTCLRGVVDPAPPPPQQTALASEPHLFPNCWGCQRGRSHVPHSHSCLCHSQRPQSQAGPATSPRGVGLCPLKWKKFLRPRERPDGAGHGNRRSTTETKGCPTVLKNCRRAGRCFLPAHGAVPTHLLR